MKSTFALFGLLSVVSASVAFAAPPKDTKPAPKKPVTKTAAKLTDVWTCPITGEKIADHKAESGKPEVVGNYRVHFCCGSCEPTFAKLSDKDKKAKVDAILKKDAAPVAKKS